MNTSTLPKNSFIVSVQNKRLFITFQFLVKAGTVRLASLKNHQPQQAISSTIENSNFISVPLNTLEGKITIDIEADGAKYHKSIIL